MFSLFSSEMLFEVLSWGRGEFLFQRLNVCEQDGPSSSSGFQHLTLQTQDANMNILVYSSKFKTCDFAPLHTLISLVLISPSETSSWWVNTYLSHLDRSFSVGEHTLMALGMLGCRTVPRSRLEDGVWSRIFFLLEKRRCSGLTGVSFCQTQNSFF